MRIETESLFLMDMIAKVQKNRLAPARFQRPYVWSKEDVIAFWTSIIKRYPMGSVLLWNPVEPGHHKAPALGPIALDSEDDADLILDGQNRLVTLAWSMTPPDAPIPENAAGEGIFRTGETLVLDPYVKTVRFMPNNEIDGMIMPVHFLFEGFNTFMRKTWQSEADDEAMVWIDSIGYCMREARIIVTTMLHATADEAREAFLHIARAGVPMRQEDFDAVLSSAT